MTENADAVILDLNIKIKNLNEVITQIEDALRGLPDKFVKEINSKIQDDVSGTTGVSTKQEDKKKKEDEEKVSKLLGGMSDAANKLADSGISILQSVFGLVEQIYQRIKKASPLLEAIEQLFNLVWTLFFMPLGNKLGEMLIPAVLQMMDDVMEIWDAFEGRSLGEMFAIAIERGVAMLSTFLINIGETLSGEAGLVGAIGNFLMNMGTFLQAHGAQILETLFKLTAWILEHIPELIGTLVGLKLASIGLQITQIAVTAASGLNPMGWAAAGIGLGATAYIATMTGVGVSNYIQGKDPMYGKRYADGGYIPSTPGGQLAIVGEGGEGEYIIPESKLGGAGGNYVINNYMMSTDEMDRHIREVVRGEVSASKLRSGF